jgi:cation diffusion facilitator family transporter
MCAFRILRFATNASWLVNWFLLFFKAIAFYISFSKAVAAALTDSVVDLLSQFVLALSDKYMTKHDPDYPIGRSRLEAISVLATASIMSMASVEVIQYSASDLYYGFRGDKPVLHVTYTMYLILAVGIGLKLVLYIYCRKVYDRTKSDSLEALAEDHFNDVLSNLAAVVTACVASSRSSLWWADPAGAIVISVVIMYRWWTIISEQIKKIVGYTAPKEFIEKVCLRPYAFLCGYSGAIFVGGPSCSRT